MNLERNGSYSINVLVGTKHHTKAHHSSKGLQEAIEGFLSESGMPFSYANPGMLQFKY